MPLRDKYFANPAALPSMPEVAMRLLRSFENDNMSAQGLADLIAQDQSLSVKLLRVANSAHYSPSHRVATIKDAVITIGMDHLRDLALAASLVGTFPTSPGFDRLRFWRQCLATAAHARVLAQACDVDPDVAYLSGLVMRTGELLMLMNDPQEIAEAEARATQPDSLIEQEEAILHCNHLEVTAELARRWHFPIEIVTGLSAAVDPMAAHPFSRLGAVLRLASIMSDAGERGLAPLATLLELQPELMHHMHLDLDQEWLIAHMVNHDTLNQAVDALLH